jgi:hypothetical protein
MASKKTLNAGSLRALGAARLAELLMEISEGNAAPKRRLRLELAAAASPTEVAKEIRKRIVTIARSRSFVDWQNRKSLVDDLEDPGSWRRIRSCQKFDQPVWPSIRARRQSTASATS